MADLSLYIEGKQAKEAASELANAIQARFSKMPTVRPMEREQKENKCDPALAVAIAAMIVDIPGAILAINDLVSRFRANDNAEIIIGLSREIMEKYPNIRITVSAAGGEGFEITKCQSNELVDLTCEIKGGN